MTGGNDNTRYQLLCAGDAGGCLSNFRITTLCPVHSPGSENRFRQNKWWSEASSLTDPAYHGRRRGGTFESQPRWGTLVDCFPDAIVRLLVNTINKQANTPAYIDISDTSVKLGHGWRGLSRNNPSISMILIFLLNLETIIIDHII